MYCVGSGGTHDSHGGLDPHDRNECCTVHWEFGEIEISIVRRTTCCGRRSRNVFRPIRSILVLRCAHIFVLLTTSAVCDPCWLEARRHDPSIIFECFHFALDFVGNVID
eukprot:PhF_6_TR41735/c0_g1_i1/m.63334